MKRKYFLRWQSRACYDPETFSTSQQAIAPDGYQHIGITIGNLQAKNTIIKVCNPYCAPCARAHPVLDEIIRNNPHVKLKLIFAATNGKNDIRGIVARHLLAISKRQPEKQNRPWTIGIWQRRQTRSIRKKVQSKR